MAWSCRQLEPTEYTKYEELVRKSPQGSLWASKGWAEYLNTDYAIWGVFRGFELVGGVLLPLDGEKVRRYLQYTPWTGIVARSRAEGENLEISTLLARTLRARYDEVTVTLSPEWEDIRGFLWNGFFPHVRYTYRSDRASLDYEKRVGIKRLSDGSRGITSRSTTIAPGVAIVQRAYGGSDATFLSDWRHCYYWKANKGGEFHTELVDAAIRDASARNLGFDLVGANSPSRGLFKRAFGQSLRSYFAVTTAPAGIDLRA